MFASNSKAAKIVRRRNMLRWANNGHRDPSTENKKPGIVQGFEFRQKFSTPLVQYLCTLPPMREGGFTGAATP
jgi:hypothetical protein